MSGLEMKSIKFSSKGGYSIEWQEPGSVRLSLMEALYLLAAFKNGLSATELEAEFTFEEREVIYRYQEKEWEQLRLLLEKEQSQTRSFQGIQKELKKQLQWCLDGLNLSFKNYLSEILGWPELDARQVKTNQAFRDALRRHCFERVVYERLIKQHGLPSPKILAEVEKRLDGPLIKETGA